jgi:hypothetical protein
MKQKGDNRAKQEACHQNQLLRLSTALTVVTTKGIWPSMALQTADAARSNLKYPSWGNNKGTNVSKRLLSPDETNDRKDSISAISCSFFSRIRRRAAYHCIKKKIE